MAGRSAGGRRLARAIEGEWVSVLMDVSYRLPGTPIFTEDLERRLPKDRILGRALELILEERRLDEGMKEN